MRVSGATVEEAELVDCARQVTAAELEKIVRSWRVVSRLDEVELERRRHRRRHLSVVPDGEGGYVVRGRLDPVVGALLMRATRPQATRWEEAVRAPLSGTRTERYQVFLHVDEDTLREDGEGGRSHLEDGTRVSAERSDQAMPVGEEVRM